MSSIFSNELFLNNNDSSASSSTLTFRDTLSPLKSLTNTITNNTNNSSFFIKNLIICTYIADWKWLSAELDICPFIDDNETKIFIIINWVPETCNTEDVLTDHVYSEGIREVELASIVNKNKKRKIYVIHPALVGGLMHVKLTLVQFQERNGQEDQSSSLSFVRTIIGSANLTADDWCNLRQAFFVAEGKYCNDDQKKQNQSPTSLNFTKQLKYVLLWLSLPKKVLDGLLLEKVSWASLPENTQLIFSVPSSLQNAINDQERILERKKKKVGNETIDEDKNEDDDDEDDDDGIEPGLPPLEPPSASGASTIRRRFIKSAAHAHDHRAAFYSEFLPIAFELNKKYVPPLQVLRSCVERDQNNSSRNTDRIQVVYQASSVGGITDKLFDHFIAATDPSLPFPPSVKNSDDQKEDDEEEERTIITPFPSASSVIQNAANGGWSGAITLRYFQIAQSKLYASGWRKMDNNNGGGPTCHSKLIYFCENGDEPSPNSWLVLGSHNFTADCWAFARQMLPRNFELSVFLPSSAFFDEVKISKLFPVQTKFDSSGDDENNHDRNDAVNDPHHQPQSFGHHHHHHHHFAHHHHHHHHHHHFSPPSMNSSSNTNDQRFVFLNHKRAFFAALQSSESSLKSRNAFVAQKLKGGDDDDNELLRAVFTHSLEYHYSKFQKEVNDDFGRH